MTTLISGGFGHDNKEIVGDNNMVMMVNYILHLIGEERQSQTMLSWRPCTSRYLSLKTVPVCVSVTFGSNKLQLSTTSEIKVVPQSTAAKLASWQSLLSRATSSEPRSQVRVNEYVGNTLGTRGVHISMGKFQSGFLKKHIIFPGCILLPDYKNIRVEHFDPGK